MFPGSMLKAHLEIDHVDGSATVMNKAVVSDLLKKSGQADHYRRILGRARSNQLSVFSNKQADNYVLLLASITVDTLLSLVPYFRQRCPCCDSRDDAANEANPYVPADEWYDAREPSDADPSAILNTEEDRLLRVLVSSVITTTMGLTWVVLRMTMSSV
ncbi:hypothetical protein T492DRAFT_836974 [Pavlovales sp. CCMP2436]|nr:hypothetical protein T492DRAFT_836974 [Pavlovales sp. CCMP2436]